MMEPDLDLEANKTVDANIMGNTRLLKEEFVSNTTGTIPTEIFLMAGVTLASFAFFAVLRILLKRLHLDAYVQKFIFIFESICIVFPILLGFTILSDDLVTIIAVMVGIIIWILYRLCFSCYTIFLSNLWNCKINDIQESYLTNYKANIQLTTAVCILAVDFNIFPRRFAKVEVYGVGVMDMAVGTIIFSNALTSRQARFHEYVSIDCLYSNLRNSAILTGLGIARTILIKTVGYQEHVTEYGTHWNFFLTIAMIKPIANFILMILRCRLKQPLFLILSLTSIAMYQWTLSIYGLENLIQNGFNGDKSRNGIIDANREGIFSCIGYLSIYFCGLFFGRQLFKKNHSLYNKLFWLTCWFIVGCICMTFSVVFMTPISRQMANISYYFIQIAFNSLLLLGFILIDMISFAAQSSVFPQQGRVIERTSIPIAFLSQSISSNLLVYFLIANVFTGLVNLSFDTLQCSVIKSISILFSYIVILNNVIWNIFTYQNQYRRKFSIE